MRNFKLSTDEENLIVMSLISTLHEIESFDDFEISEADVKMMNKIKKLLVKFEVKI